MEEQDVQNLNLPQGSSEPHTAVESISFTVWIDSPRIRYSDSQPPNWFWCDYLHPLCNEAAHYMVPLHPYWEPWHSLLATRPTVPSPEQISETSAQTSFVPGMSDGNLGDELRASADDQIHANGSTFGQLISDQEDSPNSPSDQWDGNGVQLLDVPNFQWISETGSAPSSKNGRQNSKEWPCGYKGCNKRYGRRQEAFRHMRDKHEIPHECFVCRIKWTRAEKIREHLLSRHQDHFTEEECQEIRHLRGLNDTIKFLITRRQRSSKP
ncbi:hypothetical protein DFH94DRAFT_266342 [Russula ochroleuca]|uniref:C2H2-type domain-containing protein n=1 Tax=Russula ochroleuca TaxID=152965 RepID=A0A9P5N3C5_9AGAM|nr:hypothetical protein DFH94DRAFT_266342 [Russula ochroleuca]